MNETRQKQPIVRTVSEPIASPCIRVCTLDRENVCIGCHRTIDEITRWTTMTDAERLAIQKRTLRTND